MACEAGRTKLKTVFDTRPDTGYDDDIIRRYHFPKPSPRNYVAVELRKHTREHRMNSFGWPAKLNRTKGGVELSFADWPDITESRTTVQEAVLRAKDAEIAQDQFDRERNREKAAFWANTAKVTFCLSIGAFIVGVLSAIHGLS